MRQIFMVLLLVSSNWMTYAQKQPVPGFDLPEEFNFRRAFTIEMANSNQISIELADINDLKRIRNLDSLLNEVNTAIALLKDSLYNPLTVKRIEYSKLDAGPVKLRITQHMPAGNSFLLLSNETAALKLEQDTIIILGVISQPEKPSEHKVNELLPRYYRLTLLINRITDLPELLNGELNARFAVLEKEHTAKWVGKPRTGYHLKTDAGITAKVARGYAIPAHDYLELRAAAIIQNYKSYFVPAAKLEASVHIHTSKQNWEHVISAQWEPNFVFQRNTEGKLQTYRNDFVQIGYGFRPNKAATEWDKQNLLWDISVGFLIRRKGEFYERNTFRLGMGKMQFKSLQVQPQIYFNDVFKGVTPGIRLVKYFW